ncbi:hypothetical protein AB0I54_42080 [Streptomyces sp. NPDC050625]|uniref:hypothetical protein n=1 Tax=Streptomyces sp. NPDC050625 TaxID=3154629 RepID=UPI0034253CE9
MSLLVKGPASGTLPATDTADGRFARSGPDAAWREFRSVLRLRDTMRLHVRTRTCEGGITHDRDVSTARSLLADGLAASACGASTRSQRNTPGGQSVMKQEVPRREL